MNKNNLSIILLGLSYFLCPATEAVVYQWTPEQCAIAAQSIRDDQAYCESKSKSCPTNPDFSDYGPTTFAHYSLPEPIYDGLSWHLCRAVNCKQHPIDPSPYHFYTLPSGTYSSAAWSTSCGGAGLPVKASPSVHKPQSACGSMIQLDNQVVGETIPLVGINFDLSYVSNRVVGRRGDYTIRTLITPLIVARSDLTGYEIKIWDKDPLTPLHRKSYSSDLSNAVTDNFVWKGNDSPATHRLSVSVTEMYGVLSGSSVNEVVIGSLKAKMHGLGGWTPSVLQFYDTVSSTLYRGDGSTRTVEAKHIDEHPCGASVCYDLQVAEEDGSRVYEFNADGRHLRTRLGLTGSVEFTFGYDAQGALASITEPFQRITKLQRDGSGKLTAIIGPFGQTTSVTLDTNGYLTGVANPKGDTYKMTYYGTGGLLKTFVTPTQRISTFTYDGDGNLLTDTHSGGRRASISSQSSVSLDIRKTLTTREGRVTSLASKFYPGYSAAPGTGSSYERTTTSPSGLKATFSEQSYKSVNYDGHVTFTSYFIDDPRFGTMARLLSLSEGDLSGALRSIVYNHEVLLTDPQNPFSISHWNTTATLGALLWTTQYDGLSRTYKRSSAQGRTSQVKIDALERPILTKRGNLLPIAFRYTKDQLTQVSQGARKTTLAYDPVSGLLSDITDPLNRTVSFDYDTAQRVTSQTLPDGRVIRFTYDKAGHLTSVTPPARPQHRFAINAKDLVGFYKPPPLAAIPQVATAYNYNNDDQLTRILRPDGAEITLNYDAGTGLLGTMATPLGDFVLTHKPSSDQVSIIKTPDGVRLSIDYWGHLPYSLSWQAADATTIGSYNRAFNPTTGLIDNDYVIAGTGASEFISYAYDDDEFPKQIGDMGLGYSIPNGLLSITSLGAFKDSYGYSGYGELSAYTSAKGKTKFFSLNFTRDNLGRITKKVQTLADVGTQTYDYSYDEAGRLKDVRKNGATFASYVYDDNGNRISGNRNGIVFSADYDDQDRLERQNTLKFAYNANGDLTSKTNTSSGAVTLYTYDVFGNLRTVTLPNGTVIDYEIDGLNRRIGKKVNGLLKVRYLYQDQLRIAAELNPDGTLKRRYIYATGRTTPDYYIEGAEQYKIISDYLGSPRALVKLSTNKIVYRMDHDEFGRVTLDTKPGFLPFGFAGGLYDRDTGLVRFGTRDYDPEIGRWTVKDPIGFAGGDTNLYGYVVNDPVGFADHSGLHYYDEAESEAYRKLSMAEKAVIDLEMTAERARYAAAFEAKDVAKRIAAKAAARTALVRGIASKVLRGFIGLILLATESDDIGPEAPQVDPSCDVDQFGIQKFPRPWLPIETKGGGASGRRL
jgi:RHS repeat-associated protein